MTITTASFEEDIFKNTVKKVTKTKPSSPTSQRKEVKKNGRAEASGVAFVRCIHTDEETPSSAEMLMINRVRERSPVCPH